MVRGTQNILKIGCWSRKYRLAGINKDGKFPYICMSHSLQVEKTPHRFISSRATVNGYITKGHHQFPEILFIHLAPVTQPPPQHKQCCLCPEAKNLTDKGCYMATILDTLGSVSKPDSLQASNVSFRAPFSPLSSLFSKTEHTVTKKTGEELLVSLYGDTGGFSHPVPFATAQLRCPFLKTRGECFQGCQGHQGLVTG